MIDAIRERAAEARQALDELDAILAAGGKVPGMLLCHVGITVDELAAKVIRSVDLLKSNLEERA